MTLRRLSPPRYRSTVARLPVAGLLGALAIGSHAQEASPVRSFAITPQLSVTQTLTDNINVGVGSKQGGSITEFSPRVRIDSNGGRVKGSVDYSLDGLLYAGHGSSSAIQQSLDANLNVEAVENWAFVDARANVGQQSVSAFGTQSVDSSQRNGNQTQVSSFQLQPYVRGVLGGFARYEARLNYAMTHGDASTAGSSTTSGGNVSLSDENTSRRIGWSADVSNNVQDYKQGRRTETDRFGGALIFALTPELKVTARDGRELNNIATLDREGNNTPGWGIAWAPSERTKLTIDRDRRFFGNSHLVDFEHRTPRTVWRYTDTRDTSTDATGGGTSTSQTVFNLFFSQLSSTEPDPVKRAQLVSKLLQATGISPSTLVPGGFLQSAVSLQRRQELSLALVGVRTTVIFTAMKSETSRLDPTAVPTDDLSNGNDLLQHGFTIDLSHKLSPTAALNLSASQQKSTGDQANQAANLRSLSLTWTSQISAMINLSLAGRHTVFDSPLNPYTETAIIAIATLQF